MNPLSAALVDAVGVVALQLDPVPDPADVRPGWAGVALVVGLILVTVLLWFSMRKQLGRIRFPDDTDTDTDTDPDAPDASPGSRSVGDRDRPPEDRAP